MINVGTLIASAIFIVPAAVAQELKGSLLIILVWIVGGVASLLGALSTAELGAALPRAGGQYVYLREAYGPACGFLFGWAAFMVINPASISAIAVGFATYLGFFLPLGATGVKLVAIGSIAGLTAINCLGVRPGANTQNALTFLKVAALGALVVFCFALPGGRAANFEPVAPRSALSSVAGPFGIAMVAVLWAYDGWNEITFVAGEVKDPGRNLPRAIVLSTVIVIAFYLLANLAYLYALSPERMSRSTLVASDAATVVLGAPGAALVAGAILVSTLGANNGIVLTAARVPYAVAREGLFFPWVAGVHPRFRTPVSALVFQGVWAGALTFTGTYDQLFTYVVFGEWVFYIMTCAAVITLRRKAADLPRPYRVWGYPFTPLVFIAFATWVVISTVLQRPRDVGVGAAIILVGLPGYFYWRRTGSGRTG